MVNKIFYSQIDREQVSIKNLKERTKIFLSTNNKLIELNRNLFKNFFKKMNMKNLVKFFFELAQLRFIKHVGWNLIGITSKESVAEHSLRAAQIAYVLALLENYENPEEIAMLVLFHDLHECRSGDIHKVANRYVDKERIALEQTKNLGKIGNKIFEIWKKAHSREKAAIIAKDADLLEQAITAKEYLEQGFKYAQDWINNVEKSLVTDSAKRLLKVVKKINPNEWWQELKKIK